MNDLADNLKESDYDSDTNNRFVFLSEQFVLLFAKKT